jgi:hypothetical protein
MGRLKGLFPGDNSGDKPVVVDVENKGDAESEDAGEEEKSTNDDSGEFWDFLRSTASSTPGQSNTEEPGLEETEASGELTTALADGDAPEEQSSDLLPPEDDEKKASA